MDAPGIEKIRVFCLSDFRVASAPDAGEQQEGSGFAAIQTKSTLGDSTSKMITVSKLSKNFGGKQAVKDISFEISTGEVLGFLGPNAAGKTTTMRMLTCYFPPTSGTANVAGFDIQKDSAQVRRHIGYLPENVPIYPEMTTREFIEFAASAKLVPTNDHKRFVDEAISNCNLGTVERQLVGTLSRGFRQRVGLAQAIVNKPKVLILDEPTVGLDPAQIRDIRELIKELARNSTVILSTHILPEVEALCNRVVIIAGGRIRAIDTPANLNASLQGSSRIQVKLQTSASSSEIEEAMRVLTGVREVRSPIPGTFHIEVAPGTEARPELARLVVEKGWDLLEISTQHLSLEDIFLQVVRTDAAAEPTHPAPTTAEPVLAATGGN